MRRLVGLILVVVICVLSGCGTPECHDSPLGDKGYVCDFDE